jgi:hypothetical protein
MTIIRRIFMRDTVVIRQLSESTDFAVLEGYLPPRALGLVMEWAEIHKDELVADWNLAKENRPPAPIEPLK